MSEMPYGTPIAPPAPGVTLNSESDKFDVKISRTLLGAMQDVPTPNVNAEKWQEVERWLRDCVKSAIQGRKDRNDDKRIRFRKTLAGVRPYAPLRRDVSNLSVPLTVWANAGIKARVRAGTIENDPLLSVTVIPPADTTGINYSEVAKKLIDFFTVEFRNPRALGGSVACDRINDENVPIGMAGLKVHIEPDRVNWYYDATLARVAKYVRLGRVRWDYIAADDLIYPLGYGTDTQAMPFVGHEFIWTWEDLLTMRESGYLDAEAVAMVSGLGESANKIGGSAHVGYQTHNCAEVYFDYPLYRDGLPVALCAYWHTGRDLLLGLRFNYTPKGRKPLLITNFDSNPDVTSPEGQGVCEKLCGSQDETDIIHNLGIESAKRAISHVIVLKAGTQAEQEFGGDAPLLPGDHVVTETPGDDFIAVPLGSPDGMQAAIAQEASTRQYVTRLLGLDESAVGNLESGKRVPASLGLEIKKDSRVIAAHAINNFGLVMTEGFYLTVELWKLRLPDDTLNAAVGLDGAAILKQAVFSATDIDVRSRFMIAFNASDAAATDESRKQQMLVVGQYLQGFYDRIIQYAQMAAQMPPPLQATLLSVMQKMENGARALLATIDQIHNPDDLIPKVAEMAASLSAMGQQAAGTPGGNPGAGAA